MKVHIAYGFQGEHILGVFADHDDAVRCLQAEATKDGEGGPVVDAIDGGTDHDLDGYYVETFEVTGA